MPSNIEILMHAMINTSKEPLYHTRKNEAADGMGYPGYIFLLFMKTYVVGTH